MSALQPTAIAPGTVLAAQAITKTYQIGEVEVPALRELSFQLRERELVVIVGASGSGKSTLLNILGGLDRPSGGAVAYPGGELSRASDDELTQYRRTEVGFVFQFYNLIPSLTAEENVALVTDIVDDPVSPMEALALVGLAERAHHFPSQMSGGEQQRVAIARAIAKRPKILLCDEPTGALDVRSGVRVLEVIRHANRELGTATVIITHNAVVGEMADRLLTMSDGRVVSDTRNAEPKTPSGLVW